MLHVNKYFFSPIIRIIVITLVIGLVLYFSDQYLPENYINDGTWTNLLTFCIISVLVVSFTNSSLIGKKGNSIVNYILGGISAKFIISLAYLAVYFLVIAGKDSFEDKPQKMSFLISFVFAYVIYTFLTVKYILKMSNYIENSGKQEK